VPRHPVLRKKTVNNSTYWFTKAGGDTYFGNIEEMSPEDAQIAFANHLVTIRTEGPASKQRNPTVADLIDLFLEWVQEERSEETYATRQRYCERFANFKTGSSKTRLGRFPAKQVCANDLKQWRGSLNHEKFDAQTILHAETSVRACFNWGLKHGHLPPNFRPFATVERTRVPLKVLTEADLITPAERKAVLEAASFDTNQFRRHGLAKVVAKKGTELRKHERTGGNFADLLACYYATGARTSELLDCRVKDVQFGLRQIVLGNHKRSQTERVARSRQVTLNDTAMAIFTRHCEGKKPDDCVFLRRNGRPWDLRTAAKYFDRVKEIAAATKLGTVRDTITIYDFRHLWISESMVRNNIQTVAKMAGTSIAMIERVYGHFSNKSLLAAQAILDDYRLSQDANPST
jgi:integrase